MIGSFEGTRERDWIPAVTEQLPDIRQKGSEIKSTLLIKPVRNPLVVVFTIDSADSKGHQSTRVHAHPVFSGNELYAQWRCLHGKLLHFAIVLVEIY